MEQAENGTWTVELNEDLAGVYYTYRTSINEKWNHDVPDPYARLVGVNGRRALIEDLAKSDPVNWAGRQESCIPSPDRCHYL